MQDQVKMSRYALIFIAVYTLATIAIAVVSAIFDINVGVGGSAGALIASSLIAGKKFADEHDRELYPEERTKFSIFATVLIFVVSMILIGILLFIYPIPDVSSFLSASFNYMGGLAVILVFAVIALIHYGIVWWSFGYFVKKQVDSY